MIELTEEQARVLATQQTPVEVLNPKTKETFLLIRKDGEEDLRGKSPAPNLAILAALAEVERIQEGMQPKEDGGSLNLLRQARSGEMYGYGHDD
jgi:hypothetical protein